MPALRLSLALLAWPAVSYGAEQHAAANPIRKVVNMLQAMQEKVTQEGIKEKELFDKFMCYCQQNDGSLQASIDAANDKVPAVSSDIKSSEEEHEQSKADLKAAQVERSEAESAMKTATAIREKEAAAFADEKEEYTANINAINAAVAALEKGMAGSFLQSGKANIIKRALSKTDSIMSSDREELLSFLSGTYAPKSGEITGILKQIGDEMSAGLADATSTEESAIKSYDDLMRAKTKEVKALQARIEAKTVRIGELGVSIEQLKNDLSDTQEALAADEKFIANLKSQCDTKKSEWDERSKTRADELVALADTIKILNDDDALDLFKKTLPSAASSFLQMTSSEMIRGRAMDILRATKTRAGVDFITLALQGKNTGFAKVIQMIDAMVKTLKTEQMDDDHKLEYCNAEIDVTEDNQKTLERSVADVQTAIETNKEGIASLQDEIAALTTGIKELDQSVAAATEMRQQENTEYKELMASNTAAKELMQFAKNRLNKFYNPKLYKPAPKTELTAQDRIVVSMGGTAPPTPPPGGIAGTGIGVFAQISEHVNRAAPPPPPETFGAYTAKTEENTGVIAMVDLLIKDLDKEMTEAETSEVKGQADYETAMKEAAAKRTEDSKSLASKQSMKAELEGELEAQKDTKSSTTKELHATMKYMQSLHAECDWLIKYFEVRKEARAGEVESLVKAKAVLSGADYSFVQTSARGFLRGSM